MTDLTLTEAEAAAVLEDLENEADLLCLGRPSAWRIQRALNEASDRKIAAWWSARGQKPPTTGTRLSRRV